MADLVNLTVDGKPMQAKAGMLLIDACKQAGIEIPAFCYYEGLALQAACRMCLVEVEKAPKLMASCTLPVAEGMVVKTDSPPVREARKTTLEFLLTNHPLDCPVCDKGGECELQDMVFRYGAGESRFQEIKVHSPEKQWSPVVFFDPGRCILCYRCVRICGEGMGVGALGVTNRGVVSEITPSHGDHLECDECGNCIDICPVGALTSGIYRYKARPWEMKHVGTICTHCSNGCKTTLGVRNDHIIRGNNRDRSGINNEFLCIKGRYAFDFVHHEERLQSPFMKVNGRLEPVSWSQALGAVAKKFKEIAARNGKFGVIGSVRTTNEDNYYLQKFARQGLKTNNIDHKRSGDIATLVTALGGRTELLAKTSDLYETKAALIIGEELAQQQPLLAFQLRANWRHHNSRTYVITPGPVREDKIAVRALRTAAGEELGALESLRAELAAEPELVILFGSTVRGEGVRKLVAFGDSLGIPVKYVCLVDYANSRGAMDMGLVPEFLPGYQPSGQRGLTMPEMLTATDLDALWVVGSNPLREGGAIASKSAFVVVQDMFLTETARQADVIFPAASAYEKSGTFTNVCGEVQKLKQGLKIMGSKPDLEIFGLIAKEMGLDIGIWKPEAMFEEIRKTVPGYAVPNAVLATGGAVQTKPTGGGESHSELVRSANDTLFTSGSLGRYSKILNSVIESPGTIFGRPAASPEPEPATSA